jgi:hypothetical protein
MRQVEEGRNEYGEFIQGRKILAREHISGANVDYLNNGNVSITETSKDRNPAVLVLVALIGERTCTAPLHSPLRKTSEI